ncbi:MAG TPA: Rieske 2Fe-2S domain-containing protein [Acidimicrobiales bacterium]|jgi:ubiquinol-cytochrome c reductase iron-sulfur subunit|nr:Rieske 2Fe-2S domain-containing protein [Acidimicrobiales bacterium]
MTDPPNAHPETTTPHPETTSAHPETTSGEDQGTHYRLENRPEAERFAEGRIALYWAITTIAALGLAGVYIAGGQPQLEGLLLMIALGSLGLGFVVFARDLLPGNEVTGPRHDMASTEEAREEAEEAFERGGRPFVRRRFLFRMLGLAGGALGVAAVFPINSLGPHPGDTLAHTSWKKGSRLVTSDGRPVRLGDLEVDGVLTVFPEGATDDADSQTILINVGDAAQTVRTGRGTWSVQGYVAFSKVCTHAGCPVGLYRSTSHQLLCPCHQSTFNVLDECRPVFGPATRSLPQLALEVNGDGYLTAQHDFSEPVGPGYWNRP